MTTQNKTNSIRPVVQKLIYNISVLYQNGEITSKEKDEICKEVKQSLVTGDTSKLHARLSVLRYGSLFPEIVDDCLQLVSN